MKKKIVVALLAFVLTVPLLAACMKNQSAGGNAERVLRIAIIDYDEQYFRQQFTDLFEFANQNITVEVIPVMSDYRYGNMNGEQQTDPFEKLKETMQGDNPPDVVMFDYSQLADLVENNLLVQLDPLITKDQFDTSTIVPAVLEGLKREGDNKLYALAPLFQPTALIYNKTIFDQAGVDYPTDNMTWEQTFDLARRLTNPDGDHPVYGFSFNTSYGDLFYGMQQYVAPLNLSIFNEDGSHMTVDSDQWEKVWTTFVQLGKDGVTPPVDDGSGKVVRDSNHPFSYDDFMSGRLAMALIGYGQLDFIINANKNAANYEGFEPIPWDVVTVPSHPEAPGVGGMMYMSGVMGINAKAQNMDDAWNYLKFVNGEEWAKYKSYGTYQMSSRKSQIKPPDGLDFNIEAFFNVTPAPRPPEEDMYRKSVSYYQIHDLGRQLFTKALQGELEVREALKQWKTQGDQMLQSIKENPGGIIEMPATVPAR